MKKFGCFWDHVSGFLHKSLKNRSTRIKNALWMMNGERAAEKWISREKLFWQWFVQFRKQMQYKSRRIMISATLLAAFDWEKERIEFDSVKSELREFEFVERLKKNIFCLSCDKRIQIGNFKVAEVEYCTCKNQQKHHEDGWEPYIENKWMITWRREEKPGLYAYKVYVVYPDVSAEDFLFVQTDVNYRRCWDDTAIELKIVENDTQSDSQIIYWEMLWPKLFNNRDYVYNRRYFIDEESKMIIIVNRSTKHPRCPKSSSKQRVNEYWSNIVVKPKTEFNKPGIEFVLTYFDNPGLSIPKSITTWVAQRQMPDFLEKLHQATLSYANERKLKQKKSRDIWRRDPGFEYPNLEHEELDKENDDGDDFENMTTTLPNNAEQENTKAGWFSWFYIKKLLLLN